MLNRKRVTIDGNEAAASVAYRTNEVIAIYPITPASPMGELSDAWSAKSGKNIWGQVPEVAEMQSEAGAAGTVHGSLQAGALTTTFTASQGLLLMVPNLYKIAGELHAFCLHVAARSIATHALSIFGDHSDVMAVRQTGMAMLCSSSVQEAHDFACISHSSTLVCRVPFLHFFDGFRTSHEIGKIELLSDDDLRFMIDEEAVAAHRARALTPDRPSVRGTAQNPDVFFQSREACSPFYPACFDTVVEKMKLFGERTGRNYQPFEYYGDPNAERVIILMGSGAETVRETALWLAGQGEKVGMLKINLYRPFSTEAFLKALPKSTRQIAVLDRTKEAGAVGEPLYLDVQTALSEHRSEGSTHLSPDIRVIGGRYGLSSKEFHPGMVKAIFDELSKPDPKNHFTIGIVDDVSHSSLTYDPDLDIEGEDVVRALFFGLGSDGTVGANKNSIKIIGEETDLHAQGYFVYDSKKSGATTISHLRFGPHPIHAPYLIRQAGFIGCHQFEFLDRFEMLELASPGAVFLLNAPYGPEDVFDRLPREVQTEIIEKALRFYVIDGYRVARDAGLGVRINTIMQACFFAISGVLPRDEALAKIKETIEKTYGKRGPVVVEQNFKAVDAALGHLHEVSVPAESNSARTRPPIVAETAPDFVQKVTSVMLANKGDALPVSAFPIDGTWPIGTSKWEKRNLAQEIPVWDPDVCIQCNWCALVCPHAAIRAKVYDNDSSNGKPDSFKSTTYRGAGFKGLDFTIQVAPADCTGCNLCTTVCPAKDKSNPRHKAINMQEQRPIREREEENYRFFLDLPEADRTVVEKLDAKSSQLLQPLFEYSGACAGCGETPYIKLMTQLFGDRTLIANATGCSSIYGGNLPTTPYTVNRDGRGPAWSNSLFEDNAEFGFGFRLAVEAQVEGARQLTAHLRSEIGEELASGILDSGQATEAEIQSQRARVGRLREILPSIADPRARKLEQIVDYLVTKSVWIVGGDGWAYDIGYGGLDHVLSQNRDINVLVLDTEVYSNTGGQQSKATPLGAAAKFAAAGKEIPKKDLGLEAMSYRHVYVAQVAFGANYNQVVHAFTEAASYRGPSLIIAQSPCVAHGYDLRHGAEQQKLAMLSGAWPLYRFDPRRISEGKPPLQLDSKAPSVPLDQYMRNETRFRMVEKQDPERFKLLAKAAQEAANQRFSVYAQLAGMTVPLTEVKEEDPGPESPAQDAASENGNGTEARETTTRGGRES